ncbi:hypothetical protein ACOSQ3_032010 [Xanthoceras sorbifolium]
MATSSFSFASLFQVTSLTLFLAHVSLLFLSTPTEADTRVGFSVDLIHRDSPLSPLYNSSETYTDRMNNAFRRSIWHINRFRTSSSASTEDFQSPIFHDVDGEYFMAYNIGTPPIKQFGVIDTGSDFIWTKCRSGGKEMFNPKVSSTYKDILYDSEYCKAMGYRRRPVGKICGYDYNYADRSSTSGVVASETFSIMGPDQRTVLFTDTLAFGCSQRENREPFEDPRLSGIIGLGGGFLSLSSQSSKSIKGKFSYCFVESSQPDGKGKINFGSIGMDPSSNQVVSIPFLIRENLPFYHLTLVSIFVNDQKIEYSGSVSIPAQGNMIIDSGSAYTYIHPEVYKKVKELVMRAIRVRSAKDPVPDAELKRLCYSHKRIVEIVPPTIKFQFSGGVNLTLTRSNTFIKLADQIECLTIVSEPEPEQKLAVFGSYAQSNFMVGYDVLDQKKIFFMPNQGCTE